ncbi:Lipoprotein [Comamonas aquatilis]
MTSAEKNQSKMAAALVPKAVSAIALVVLVGCGNQPPAPDWALSAEAAAQRANSAYLQGQQRVEALQWQKAREAVAGTARPDLAARVELMRCAAQVASLQWDSCPGYEKLAQDAAAPEQAYARYLQGRPLAADVALLPEAQRAVAAQLAGLANSAAAEQVVQAVAGIKDPLPRLVAAGVALRAGAASPQLLQLGVDTASAQGWRRAVMAWLLLQAKAAEQGGDAAGAAAIERRIQLLQKPVPESAAP